MSASSLVRDEGVAGSNPATPTNDLAENQTATPTISPNSMATRLWQPTYAFLYARLDLAKRRAKKRGREFTITVADLREIGDAQHWCCALTGIPFDCSSGKPWANPFTLSIDRRDNSGGYTRANIRLIVHGLNVALGPWGEAAYAQIAREYVRFAGSGKVPPRDRVVLAGRRPKRIALGRPSTNTSGFKGVSLDKRSGRWEARATIEGRRICLGRFSTAEDAAGAYDAYMRRAYGETYKHVR